jgi:hypothetical protein
VQDCVTQHNVYAFSFHKSDGALPVMIRCWIGLTLCKKIAIMEGKINNKRAKYLRRKVVFVDPEDPDAPHWWPALVNLVLDL